MNIFETTGEVQEYVKEARQNGKLIGFVPTMGALHQGHLSLIEASRAQADETIVSIFVNPAQFNDPADYTKYPITTDKDIEMLKKSRTNVLFLPSVQEVYPDGLPVFERYDLGYLETLLEGAYRPGHFQGVCQVMARLLNVVRTNHLYMGQKDYQQCMVVKRLLELLGIDKLVELHICPTVREPDGLAMSSRNLRLTPSARQKAVVIYRALRYVKEYLYPGHVFPLAATAREMLQEEQMQVDYFEIADAETLSPIIKWDGQTRLVAVTAAFIDEVRLIDNMLLN
ncbi:MAG TPA: pantoate--beta-alanine ligase [Chitinophagaceae bacterium]|nr:pantoate--beta-alanine ligase [Chitinophagaceae bacterium]